MNGNLQTEPALFGDLIFVSGGKLFSRINKAWQKRLSGSKSILRMVPSHVAICVVGPSQTGIFDSLPRPGVKYGSLVKFYRESKSQIEVYRNIDLEKRIKNGVLNESALTAKLDVLWGERYNFVGALFKKKGARSKFCSEAVAAFFSEPIINIFPSDTDPGKYHPIDLYELCQDNTKWRRVEHESQKILNYKLAKNSFPEIDSLKQKRKELLRKKNLNEHDMIRLKGLEEEIRSLEDIKKVILGAVKVASNTAVSFDKMPNEMNKLKRYVNRKLKNLKK